MFANSYAHAFFFYALQMDHDAFVFTFIKMLKSAMQMEENNEFAQTTMLFCAKVAIAFEGEQTHPLLMDTCDWVMTVMLFLCFKVSAF